MAATGVSLTVMCVRFSRYPSLAKTIIVRLLKFAGYVHYFKSLPGNILASFWKTRWLPPVFLSWQSRIFTQPVAGPHLWKVDSLYAVICLIDIYVLYKSADIWPWSTNFPNFGSSWILAEMETVRLSYKNIRYRNFEQSWHSFGSKNLWLFQISAAIWILAEIENVVYLENRYR